MSRFNHNILYVVPCCVLTILDNLVGLITLGYFIPSFGMKFICWTAKRRVHKKLIG